MAIQDLNPGAYLALHRFSKTERFVVRPANTTHILLAQLSNGQCYVCIEDLNVDGKTWTIRRDNVMPGPISHPNRGAAEAFASGLHRAETKRQKAPKIEKPPNLVVPVCRECKSNPHTADCVIRKAYNGA